MQYKLDNRLGAPIDAATAAAIELDILRIQSLRLKEIRALWRETFKREAPKALTQELLVRTLCWEIQEKAFGGHSPATLKHLASYAKGRPAETHRLRRLKPGTELVREYQGERHTVVITGQGFRWQEQDYPSLTAIACAITGTNWNGPRFFGLREGRENPGAAPTRAGAPAKAGKGSGRVEDGAHG